MKLTGKKKRQLWVLAAVVIAALVLGGSLIAGLGQLRRLQAEKAMVQAELDRVTEENEGLNRQIEETNGDDFVIRTARKLLGWIFPDEYKIIEDTK